MILSTFMIWCFISLWATVFSYKFLLIQCPKYYLLHALKPIPFPFVHAPLPLSLIFVNFSYHWIFSLNIFVYLRSRYHLKFLPCAKVYFWDDMASSSTVKLLRRTVYTCHLCFDYILLFSINSWLDFVPTTALTLLCLSHHSLLLAKSNTLLASPSFLLSK